MIYIVKAAAIELHAARAALACSADPFSERRAMSAERYALAVLERFGAELRQSSPPARGGVQR